MMTAFLSYNVGLRYLVRTDGLEDNWTDVLPFRGSRGGTQKQLSEGDLRRLSEAIRRFPPHDRYPPIGNLLVVSFMRGTNWTSHSYNWASPPPPVKEAFDIIGESWVTRHEPIK